MPQSSKSIVWIKSNNIVSSRLNSFYHWILLKPWMWLPPFKLDSFWKEIDDRISGRFSYCSTYRLAIDDIQMELFSRANLAFRTNVILKSCFGCSKSECTMRFCQEKEQIDVINWSINNNNLWPKGLAGKRKYIYTRDIEWNDDNISFAIVKD